MPASFHAPQQSSILGFVDAPFVVGRDEFGPLLSQPGVKAVGVKRCVTNDDLEFNSKGGRIDRLHWP
ncbi:MAG: hypothetical protein IOD12_12655 [Silvanigrellales bacterium]|nr:hypothetical protein [Silvanigrellales bacterium]